MAKTLFYTILASICIFVLSACSDEHKFRIGVSQCSDDTWRSKMNAEIEREALLRDDVEVEIRSAGDSNEKQIADIQYFVDNGFDIIIVSPNDAQAITPIIKKVYEGGTPVVVFDRGVIGDCYTSFQGSDNVDLGRSAAKYARHLIKGPIRAIEITGLMNSTPAQNRYRGFHQVCDSMPDFHVLGSADGRWLGAVAEQKADSLFDLFPDVNLVYAHNDNMAIAASQVARRRGLDIKVLGIDAAPEVGIQAVRDSIIDATFLYPTEGHLLLRTALNILENKPFERQYMLPAGEAVDQSNAEILLFQYRQLIESTAKVQELKSRVDQYWERHNIQTALFYAVIAISLLLIGVIFLLTRAFWQNQRNRQVLEAHNRLLSEQHRQEKEFNLRLTESTNSKLRFFTNVSHDLRTPLTLIAEPLEMLDDEHNLSENQQHLLKIARNNVDILHRLVDEILDFRRYENGKLQLHPVEADLSQLIATWLEAFRPLAKRRSIALNFTVNPDFDYSLAIDVPKIERVVFNLVSNAFKYSPDHAHIDVALSHRGADQVLIKVSDTGRGISPDDIQNIFERFYQVDKVNANGSGIGLTLAKALVELHDGSIMVESQSGQGATFSVVLPITHTSNTEPSHEPTITLSDNSLPDSDIADDSQASFDPDKPIVLVVDDNMDLRLLMRELLANDYNVIMAANGRDGLAKATRYIPDLVIADVMMPVMDGLEMCRQIKNEISTSHIPVLVVTACSMDEQRAGGYEAGADGYIAKPFNRKLFLSRCRNLIDNRKRITAASDHAPEAERPAATLPQGDIDSEFFARVMEIINAEIANPDLNVDELASRMGLGRSQFYRKIKALTNASPVELLRKHRLRRARHLLNTTEQSISEVCYATGFSAPAYFSKCFRDEFGETPSDLRSRLQGH